MRNSVFKAAAIAAAITATFSVVTVVAPATAGASGYECTAGGSAYNRYRVGSCYMPWNGQNSGAQLYLVGAATGVWSCNIPRGFTYSQTRVNDDCSGYDGVLAVQYLLQAN